MNDQRAFWKGFLLASGLAVVFWAGRVTADPVGPVGALDDTARAVNEAVREIRGIKDEVARLRSDGLPVKGSFGSSSSPVYVKVQE